MFARTLFIRELDFIRKQKNMSFEQLSSNPKKEEKILDSENVNAAEFKEDFAVIPEGKNKDLILDSENIRPDARIDRLTEQGTEGRNGEILDSENIRPDIKIDRLTEQGTEGRNGEILDSENIERPIGKQERGPVLPAGTVEIVRDACERESRGRNWWGWIKERAKGFATIGIWEFHQAERFRSQTGNVGVDVMRDSQRIQQTEILDRDSALEEASRMREMSDKEGKYDNKALSSADLERYSQTITNEKIKENNELIDNLVSASAGYLTRNLERYRDEFGESVVTPDKIGTMQNNLREQLIALQRGFGSREEIAGLSKEQQAGPSERRQAIINNPETFRANIRQSLDAGYWRRYVYGGVEAILDLAMIKIALTKLLATGVEKVAAQGASKAVESMDIPMKDTIWNTSKEWLQQHGITNPTDSEVMRISKQVAQDNGIGVQEWGISGNPMDTGMQQGHLLKFKGAGIALKAIGVARGLAGF